MSTENTRRDLSYEEENLYDQLIGLLNRNLFDEECLLGIKILDDLIDEILKYEEISYKINYIYSKRKSGKMKDLYTEGKLETLLSKYNIKDLEELEKALTCYRMVDFNEVACKTFGDNTTRFIDISINNRKSNVNKWGIRGTYLSQIQFTNNKIWITYTDNFGDTYTIPQDINILNENKIIID